MHLIKRDASSNWPTANELKDILRSWWVDFDNQKKQIKEAVDINNNLSTNSTIPPTSLALSYEAHSEAMYTSRILSKPINSDDYYKTKW